MSRPCAACSHPDRAVLDRKLRSGATIVDVVRWLATTERPIQRNAVSRHANSHLGVTRLPGPRPPATPFLERIVSLVDADLESGAQRPNVTQAISAQAEINRQQSRDTDRDWTLKLAMILSGHAPLPLRALDEFDLAREAIEGELRPLLEAGN